MAGETRVLYKTAGYPAVGSERVKGHSQSASENLVTVNGTIRYIIHDLLLVKLFDVEYYRDLEM